MQDLYWPKLPQLLLRQIVSEQGLRGTANGKNGCFYIWAVIKPNSESIQFYSGTIFRFYRQVLDHAQLDLLQSGSFPLQIVQKFCFHHFHKTQWTYKYCSIDWLLCINIRFYESIIIIILKIRIRGSLKTFQVWNPFSCSSLNLWDGTSDKCICTFSKAIWKLPNFILFYSSHKMHNFY